MPSAAEYIMEELERAGASEKTLGQQAAAPERQGEQIVAVSAGNNPVAVVRRADGTQYTRPATAKEAGKDNTARPGGGAPGGGTSGGNVAPPTKATPPAATTTPPGAWVALGISRGEYEDYSAMTKSALITAGILGYDSTDSEIVKFARAHLDPAGILAAYSNRPEFIARNPGLPYGMSRADYLKNRKQVESGFGALFADPSDLSQVTSMANDPTSTGAAPAEADWFKETLKENMTPAEVQAGLTDQQKRLGTPPTTAADVAGFRTRPTVKTADDRAGVAQKRTALGPTADIGKPETASPFARRK